MSTELKDHDEDYGPHELRAFGGTVQFEFTGPDDPEPDTADMNKADFIAAVETELNGIFISRDELPTEFSTEGLGPYADVIAGGRTVFQFNRENDTYEGLRQSALNVLAAAEYLKKNPPFAVDEGQVKALASLLDNAIAGIGLNDEAARRLIATGKVAVSTD